MKNLKNRLDEIPQDFNVDGLWSKIEKKDTKKRRALWVYFSRFVGILGLMLLIWLYLNQGTLTSRTASNPQKVDGSTHLNEDEDILIRTNALDSGNAISSTMQEVKTATLPAKTIQSGVAKKEINKEVVSDVNQKNSTLIVSQNSSREALKQHLTEIYESSERPEAISNMKERELSSTRNAKNTLVTYLSKMTIDNEGPLVAKNVSDNLSKVETQKERIVFTDIARRTSQVQFIQPVIESPLIQPQILINGPKNYDFRIALSTAYGMGNHTFDGRFEQNESLAKEEELELWNVGLRLYKSLGRIILNSGFTYNVRNTGITFEEQTGSFIETSSIRDLYGVTVTEVFTSYKLYNSYNTLDIDVGVGYELVPHSIWSLIPSINLGYSLVNKSSGTYLDINKTFLFLEESENYNGNNSIFGQLSLEANVQVKKHLAFGLYGFLQNKRFLSDGEEIRHSSQPAGIGVQMSFVF